MDVVQGMFAGLVQHPQILTGTAYQLVPAGDPDVTCRIPEHPLLAMNRLIPAWSDSCRTDSFER